MSARIGIYPGTFDPITIGHMSIIRRSLKLVDELIIGVAVDIPKTPIFSVEKRVDVVRKEITPFIKDGAKIRVESFSGLLVEFAMSNRASIIIRGLRAISDFEYELQMACMNNRLNADIETVFLPAHESTHYISSRFVKEIARLGGDIKQFVSKEVAELLKAYYNA